MKRKGKGSKFEHNYVNAIQIMRGEFISLSDGDYSDDAVSYMHEKLEAEASVEFNRQRGVLDPESATAIKELFESMSSEAREVVMIFFEAPLEIMELVGYRDGRFRVGAKKLRQFLQLRTKDVDALFKEIKVFVGEYFSIKT